MNTLSTVLKTLAAITPGFVVFALLRFGFGFGAMAYAFGASAGVISYAAFYSRSHGVRNVMTPISVILYSTALVCILVLDIVFPLLPDAGLSVLEPSKAAQAVEMVGFSIRDLLLSSVVSALLGILYSAALPKLKG